MAQAVKYKKPRKINPVSITLAFIACVIGWIVYQYVPYIFLKQEAFRVLDETGSKLAHRDNYYKADRKALTTLTKQMSSQLRLVGVRDPQMEYWIEIDSPTKARLGCLFSYWIEWPADVIPKQEKVVELEYTVKLSK
jgi:hypothetical protein